VFSEASAAEQADVVKLDLEDLFTRFRAANTDLGDNTATSYEGRVRAAINQFSSFIGGGGGAGGEPTTMGTLAIPLRTGVVRIDGLPSDLTPAEANRIATMIVAMAS
jgi:hypothetical protein